MDQKLAARGSVRVLLSLAMVAAQLATAAAPARLVAAEGAPMVIDIALDHGGVLRGSVADRQGAAAARVPVTLLHNGNVAAQAKTDEQGSFEFDQVRGGVYLITAGEAGQICRAWAPGTAPPAAVTRVLVVADSAVSRGQLFAPTSLYEWFETHPVLGYTLVTAAIALPIILANLDDDDSAS